MVQGHSKLLKEEISASPSINHKFNVQKVKHSLNVICFIHWFLNFFCIFQPGKNSIAMNIFQLKHNYRDFNTLKLVGVVCKTCNKFVLKMLHCLQLSFSYCACITIMHSSCARSCPAMYFVMSCLLCGSDFHSLVE